jgi:hypothetical protein
MRLIKGSGIVVPILLGYLALSASGEIEHSAVVPSASAVDSAVLITQDPSNRSLSPQGFAIHPGPAKGAFQTDSTAGSHAVLDTTAVSLRGFVDQHSKCVIVCSILILLLPAHDLNGECTGGMKPARDITKGPRRSQTGSGLLSETRRIRRGDDRQRQTGREERR